MITKKKLRKNIDELCKEIQRLNDELDRKEKAICKVNKRNVIRINARSPVTYNDLLMRQEHYSGRMIEKWLDEEKDNAKRRLCDALYSRFDEFGTVYISETPLPDRDGIIAYIDVLERTEADNDEL